MRWSGAAANRINVDAAAVAVLSEADAIFALKEEQKTALILLFWHRSSPWGSGIASGVVLCTNRKPQAVLPPL